MNKVFIFIAGFFVIAILSGCVSARKQQNPQPKAEVLCEEWNKNLFAANQKILTPRAAAEQFIEACNIGDYANNIAGSYSLWHYYKNSTVKSISPVRDFWTVTVVRAEDLCELCFTVKKINVVENGRTVRVDWRVLFPFESDIIKEIEKQKKSKSQSSANVGNSNTAKSGKKFGLPGKLK